MTQRRPEDSLTSVLHLRVGFRAAWMLVCTRPHHVGNMLFRHIEPTFPASVPRERAEHVRLMSRFASLGSRLSSDKRAWDGSGQLRLKMTRPLGMVFIWYFDEWA